jgi:phage-related protein
MKVGGNRMGLTFNDVHSDTFGICVKTKSITGIPTKKSKKVKVQGRDAEVIFEDSGYDNIELEFECKIVDDLILHRRKNMRLISQWLRNTGTLILDYEPDVSYDVVRTIHNIDVNIIGYSLPIDEFTIKFECRPNQTQLFYNSDMTWEDSDALLQYADLPWVGYERVFDCVGGEELSVINAGTYKALPIIKLEGMATEINIGDLTINNLAGELYIDCADYVVYSESGGVKTPQMSKFEGEFLVLEPGENTFSVSGTLDGTVTVTFDYKNEYL